MSKPYFVVDDILPKDFAMELRDYIISSEETILTNRHMSDKDAHSTPITDKNLNSSLLRGNFTYRWKRNNAVHEKGCTCKICYAREEYLNKKVANIVSEHFGRELKLDINFGSIYESGDFLSIHTDGKWTCAFILNLSTMWRPEYGGLLHIDNEDGTWTAITPKFNSLTIMDVSNRGKQHFVSEVTPRTKSKRVALTGWYK